MLNITGLSKRYGDIVALDEFGLEAHGGRLVGFLGANGAGKTTTMRAIFGLIQPDAGQLTWDGNVITGEQRRRFGYMPEQRGLYARIPIGEQLEYFGRLHGMTKANASVAATSMLEELGLNDRRADKLETLSHGNQQRIQLGVALVHNPDLLVLDEPFSGLDPVGVTTMIEVLRARASAGVAVVFSSHQLELVEDLCDDVILISHGHSVLHGTIDDVRSRAGRRVAEVSMANGVNGTAPEIAGTRAELRHGGVRYNLPHTVTPNEVLAALDGFGTITAFNFRLPSLSEVFLSAVGEPAVP